MKRFPLWLGLAFLMLWTWGCVRQPPLGWPSLTPTEDRVLAVLGMNVVALDPETGQAVWTFSWDKGQLTAPISVGESLLLTGDQQGRLVALNPQDGSLAWSALETGHPFVAPVVVEKDRLYAPSGDGILYVLDASGQVLWRFPTQGPLWAGAVVDGERVYMASMDHNLYVLNAATGERMEKQALPAGVAAAPLLQDGTLYVPTLGAGILALDSETLETRWQALESAWLWHTPVWTPEGLALGDMKGTVYLLDPDQGAVRQKWTLDSAVIARPTWDGTYLYVATEGGGLYVLDPQIGEVVRKHLNPEWEERLYAAPVVTEKAILLALQGKTPQVVAVNPSGEIAWEYTPK